MSIVIADLLRAQRRPIQGLLEVWHPISTRPPPAPATPRLGAGCPRNPPNAAYTQYRGESGKLVREIFSYFVLRVERSWSQRRSRFCLFAVDPPPGKDPPEQKTSIFANRR